MKIIVHGAGGKMGSQICRLISLECKDLNLVAKVSRHYETDSSVHNYASLQDVTECADCLVDFSNRMATEEVLNYCIEKKMALLLGTTGHNEKEIKMIKQAADKIPVFSVLNLSFGIAFLAETAKMAARTFPNADVEILETHHNQKWDVPSGTAWMLANEIKRARGGSGQILLGRATHGLRQKGDICIHSLRLGNEVGTHQILFSTGSETITLCHQATDRSVFARGALQAVRFLQAKPAGLYGMKDLLQKELKE